MKILRRLLVGQNFRKNRVVFVILVLLMLAAAAKVYVKQLFSHGYRKLLFLPAEWNRGIPLIFVRGIPHMDMNDVTKMLNKHPAMDCRDFQLFSDMWQELLGRHMSKLERYEEGGFSHEQIYRSIAAHVLKILEVQHFDVSRKRVCLVSAVKDKQRVVSWTKIFPNSKFLYIINDGRDFVHKLANKSIGTVRQFHRYVNLSRTRGRQEYWMNYTGEILFACQAAAQHCSLLHAEALRAAPYHVLRNTYKQLEVEVDKRADVILRDVNMQKKETGAELVEIFCNWMNLKFPNNSLRQEFNDLLKFLSYRLHGDYMKDLKNEYDLSDLDLDLQNYTCPES